jgi:hypothetical protein
VTVVHPKLEDALELLALLKGRPSDTIDADLAFALARFSWARRYRWVALKIIIR